MNKLGVSGLLERALEMAGLRHKALAHNIANVDTPGYKRFDVAMQAALKSSVSSDPATFVYRQTNTSLRLDGNNVDVEHEMSKVAENDAYFNAVAGSLSRRLSTMRYLINEGRR